MNHTDLDRERALTELLDAVLDDRVDHLSFAGDSFADTLEVLRLVFAARWGEAAALARASAPVARDDALGAAMRQGASAWAEAGIADAALSPADLVVPDLSHELGRFAAHLMIEAALAHARVDLAAGLAKEWGDQVWRPLRLAGREHRFDVVRRCCRIRVLAFHGDLGAAQRLLPDPRHVGDDLMGALQLATISLVRGNTADPVLVRGLARLIDQLVPMPRGFLGAGTHMLTGFGLVAFGDVGPAVDHLLRAGGDEEFSRLNIIDRVLGLEFLVALACAQGQVDDALAWRDRALPLLASPIADSTVARIEARICLAQGRPDEALVWAEQATSAAKARQRGIEGAEGDILIARARLALPGQGARARTARELSAIVQQAEAQGYSVVRRAAARELRRVGLRIKPLSGSAWAGLSEREATVARLIADGASNREIGQKLQVSEHTVRSHVSRVLAAFGVATRSALPQAMGLTDDAPSRPPLTARQREVVGLVAQGLTNAEIGGRLGVSPRTVERHVGDILLRWNLPGRTSIARAAAAPVSAAPVAAAPVAAAPVAAAPVPEFPERIAP